MGVFNIYIAGAMGGIPYTTYKPRRNDIKNGLTDFYNNNSNSYPYILYVTDPSDYYNYNNQVHKTEKEVMNFELNKVRHSDLIVVDFYESYSLGTMTELTIAHEHRIPIIGINDQDNILHPWQIEMCERIFDSIDDAVMYIGEFYLS